MEYRLEYHGSVCLVHPEDDECREWIDENVQEDAQFWAGALVVEPRYLDTLVHGMEGAEE